MSTTNTNSSGGAVLRNPNLLIGFSKHFEPETPKATPGRNLEHRDDWHFLQDDGLGFMAVLINLSARQVWMSYETYTTILGSPVDAGFTNDLSRWGSGMRYLVTDAGKYAEVARAAGGSTPAAIDPLTTLENDARAILLQVAHFEGSPTHSQVVLFAERLADARARAEALREQVERIDAHLELAGVAIMDATE